MRNRLCCERITVLLAERSHPEIKSGSDKGFGLIFAVAFTIVAMWPLTGDGGEIRTWALGVAAAFLLIAFIAPNALAPLNRIWFRLGTLLGQIVTPIVLALLFYLMVTPIGVIMRLRGKDLLRKKIDRSAGSYWIKREDPVGTMKNQF